MTLKGKSILVTGGTGFIGSRLIEKLVLEHDSRVRILVRNFAKASRIACLPVELRGGDVTDKSTVENALRGCDVVFHCAYDFGGGKNWQKKVGIQGTRNVSEGVLREGVARMVHVSTFAVYGPTCHADLRESSPWQDRGNIYTQVKRAAERLVIDLYRRRHLPVVVMQPTRYFAALYTGVTTLTKGCTCELISSFSDSAETQKGRAFIISNGLWQEG